MIPAIEPMLYVDLQRLPPAGCCPNCGGEVYFPSLTCCRCQEVAK